MHRRWPARVGSVVASHTMPKVSTADVYNLAITIVEIISLSATAARDSSSPRGVLRRATMFEDVLNDIQDSIGRLHQEIEAKRKRFNDALDANRSPEGQGKELVKLPDQMKRSLDKCCRAFKVLTERL
jgi:hypothetical protein